MSAPHAPRPWATDLSSRPSEARAGIQGTPALQNVLENLCLKDPG
jgi:hypothetical protein